MRWGPNLIELWSDKKKSPRRREDTDRSPHSTSMKEPHQESNQLTPLTCTSQTPELWEMNSCWLSHPVCSILLQQPEPTNTVLYERKWFWNMGPKILTLYKMIHVMKRSVCWYWYKRILEKLYTMSFYSHPSTFFLSNQMHKDVFLPHECHWWHFSQNHYVHISILMHYVTVRYVSW